MKSSANLVFCMCLLLLTTTASAFENGYIGLAYGAAKTTDIHNQIVDVANDMVATTPGVTYSAVESDDGGKAFKLYGGVNISPNLDMQAGYVNFGNIKSTIQNIQVSGTPVGDLTAAVKLQGITFAAVPKVTLINNLDLFGKLGIAYFSGKSSVRNPIIGTIDDTDTGASAIAGAGIAVNSEKFSFTVEYERYQRVMEDTNFNFFSLGIRSNF